MRKLKLQVQMTVDGYVARPNGELDWTTHQWDEKLVTFVNELTDSSDTILLGRKMTDGFVNYWEGVVNNHPDSPEFAFAQKMVNKPKVVFSRTLHQSTWNNTKVAYGDLAEEVTHLKNLPGNDLIVYGGAGFVSSLIKHGLIDEFYLFINPVTIGDGLAIFNETTDKQTMTLVKSIPFDCGIIVLHYEPKRSE